MISQTVSDALRAVASVMRTPIVIILLILIAITIILLGSIIGEWITSRRYLKVKMPEMVNKIRSCDCSLVEVVETSGLLKHQRKLLAELAGQTELSDVMREALAVRLLAENQSKYDTVLAISNLIARIGPMLGLLGTLIPLGPGLIALGQGDTYTLSVSLLTAFDTTIAGLLCAAVALVISAIRKKWYKNYMSIMETIMECILDQMRTASDRG
jgi:biopolymer transport protein ExbB/TolQ